MVSLCIPTKNAGPDFARYLSAWRNQRTSEELEIVIVDSGSIDSTIATARGSSDRFLTISPDEFNHGETRNLLAREARGDLLIFTVQDACPAHESVLAELTSPLRCEPALAAVSGKQLPHRGADLVARWELAYHNSIVDRGPTQRRLRGLPPPSGDFLKRFQSAAFDNVCSALRRSVWEAHPFARINYGEDLEWSVRVLRTGCSLLRNPAACVYHSHNSHPYQRLKRAYAARRAASEILELPPVAPALNPVEVYSAIGTYLALVARLQEKLARTTEPVQRLFLSVGALCYVRGLLGRISPALPGTGNAFRKERLADHLARGFNWAAGKLLAYHGGLSRSDAQMVTLQLAMQVLGDGLAVYAHAGERQAEPFEWIEEFAGPLTRGV